MKTIQLFLAKFALLLSLLTVCSFSSGCVLDYSTLQVGCLFASSCTCDQLLGSGGSSGGCGDITAIPSIPGMNPASWESGFSVQTVFIDARQSIVWYIYNADDIYIFGLYLGNDTGLPGSSGTMYQFGSTSGNPADPSSVSTGSLLAPIPGFIWFPNGIVPGTWQIEWVTSKHSFEFQALNIPVIQGTSVGTDACNGQFMYDEVFSGQTVVMRCFIHNLGAGFETAGTALTDPTIANTLIAGDMHDLHLTDPPLAKNVTQYQPGRVFVLTYDINGTNVGCLGYVVGCGADVTVNGDGTLTLPAWALAWASESVAGFYTGTVFAIDPTTGNWVTSDAFGFQISNGGEPVYRFYIPCNGDHWFGLATDPVPYCGYLESNAAFYVYGSAAIFGMTPDVVPIYRMLTADGFNFYTDNAYEAQYYKTYYGWYDNGLYLGYVMPWQQNYNTTPLYRLTDGGSRHFYTASWDEVMADVQWGWIYEGIQCFVPIGR